MVELKDLSNRRWRASCNFTHAWRWWNAVCIFESSQLECLYVENLLYLTKCVRNRRKTESPPFRLRGETRPSHDPATETTCLGPTWSCLTGYSPPPCWPLDSTWLYLCTSNQKSCWEYLNRCFWGNYLAETVTGSTSFFPFSPRQNTSQPT